MDLITLSGLFSVVGGNYLRSHIWYVTRGSWREKKMIPSKRSDQAHIQHG